MNAELHYEISNFLYHEAYLLDHRKYKEWLDLLSEELVYQMPIRVTSDNKDASNLVYEMKHFEETKKSLTTRANRLYTTSAWVDNPATRQRHFVSNITIAPGPGPDAYLVRSYFLFKRSRASDIEAEQMFGEREDVLRKENGEWKIVSRTIYPDQSILSVMNLGMFL